jgi:DNA repair protein RadC
LLDRRQSDTGKKRASKVQQHQAGPDHHRDHLEIAMTATVHYPTETPQRGDKTILRALAILERRLIRPEEVLSSPMAVRAYLALMLATLPHEVFCIVFLDAQNRLIATEQLFRGTLTQTTIYPREVVKRALHHNAAGVILAHNHPSGVAEPSQADRWLTDQLKAALALVDVRVLDHFVVAGTNTLSFAERGML